MKTIIIIFAIAFAFISTNVFAQKRNATSKQPIKKTPNTISGGVMNGRALNLVVPKYPGAACAIGVYGEVGVQILIGVDGKVLTAKAVSGHPLLRVVSENAARRSEFEPVTLGNVPVRVSGLIIYQYLAKHWNWLEIGFQMGDSSSFYFSRKHSRNIFPPGFEDEWQLLRSVVGDAEQNRTTATALISNKLIDDQKSLWLFQVGYELGKAEDECCEFGNSINTLRSLLYSKPTDISPAVEEQLISLIEMADNETFESVTALDSSEIRHQFRALKENLQMFGK